MPTSIIDKFFKCTVTKKWPSGVNVAEQLLDTKIKRRNKSHRVN